MTQRITFDELTVLAAAIERDSIHGKFTAEYESSTGFWWVHTADTAIAGLMRKLF
jgi:hypothetical protein